MAVYEVWPGDLQYSIFFLDSQCGLRNLHLSIGDSFWAFIWWGQGAALDHIHYPISNCRSRIFLVLLVGSKTTKRGSWRYVCLMVWVKKKLTYIFLDYTIQVVLCNICIVLSVRPNRTEFTKYQSFGSVLFGLVWFGSVFLGNTERNFSDETRGPRANLSPLFT